MTSRYKLKARLLLLLVTLLIFMQIIVPSRIWTALLIFFGGAWLLAYF